MLRRAVFEAVMHAQALGTPNLCFNLRHVYFPTELVDARVWRVQAFVRI